MTSKEQFIQNQNLASWWGGISQDARFDQVLLHASGVALESCPSSEQRAGVLAFKEILLTLSDKEAEPVKFVSPGLDHNLEVQRRTVEAPKPAAPLPAVPPTNPKKKGK
jgi:hypothetical protein